MRTNVVRAEDNVYYLRRPPLRSAAIARLHEQSGRRFLMAGYYVVAGALIGLALANLPALSRTIVAALEVLPRYPM